jgi:hypothetical protein
MQITILGKHWKFERVGKVPPGEDGKPCIGHCDLPHVVNKRILVAKNLRGRIELDTIIHEILHAADSTKDEEWVDEVARDMAIILHDRLGYRRGLK